VGRARSRPPLLPRRRAGAWPAWRGCRAAAAAMRGPVWGARAAPVWRRCGAGAVSGPAAAWGAGGRRVGGDEGGRCERRPAPRACSARAAAALRGAPPRRRTPGPSATPPRRRTHRGRQTALGARGTGAGCRAVREWVGHEAAADARRFLGALRVWAAPKGTNATGGSGRGRGACVNQPWRRSGPHPRASRRHGGHRVPVQPSGDPAGGHPPGRRRGGAAGHGRDDRGGGVRRVRAPPRAERAAPPWGLPAPPPAPPPPPHGALARWPTPHPHPAARRDAATAAAAASAAAQQEQQAAEQEAPAAASPPAPASAPAPPPAWSEAGATCIACGIGVAGPGFASAAEQRGHFKTDWHRYNVRRRVAKKPPISEEQFDRIVEEDEDVSRF
jgi:hypothetical protein